jgi:hypothetical protein
VLKGGTFVFGPGGVESGLKLSSGATVSVTSGGAVSGLTVSGGVSLVVASGGAASSTVLSGGIEAVAAGGIVGGTTSFGANATLALAASSSVALTVSGFKATDAIDLAGFAFKSSTEKLSFTPGKGQGPGTLTVTDGSLKATITLFGQYVAAGFHFGKGAGVGTVITYSTAKTHLAELAVPRG